jgi:hypothetical protein
VSAAASVVVACRQRRFLLRLVATDGTDSGFAAGTSHVEAIMERLAAIRASYANRRLHALAGSLVRGGGSGALVALLGGRSPTEADVLGGLRTSFTSIATVVFTPGRAGGGVVGAGRGALVVDEGTSFAEVWDGAMSRRSRTGGQAVTR